MAAQVADVADIDGQVVARLPLNIERLVHRVGKLVVAVVDRKGEERRHRLRSPPHWADSRVAGLPRGTVARALPPGILKASRRIRGAVVGSHVGTKP